MPSWFMKDFGCGSEVSTTLKSFSEGLGHDLVVEQSPNLCKALGPILNTIKDDSHVTYSCPFSEGIFQGSQLEAWDMQQGLPSP